jgi:hypothetical protein
LICDNFAVAYTQGTAMLKILLPVDGSPSAVRATQTLIDTLGWYKEAPSLDYGLAPIPKASTQATYGVTDTIMVFKSSKALRCSRPAASCSRRPAWPARSIR